MRAPWSRARPAQRERPATDDPERRWDALPDRPAFLARHRRLDGVPGCPDCRRALTYEVPLTTSRDPRRVVICPACHRDLYRSYDVLRTWPEPGPRRAP